MVKVIVDRFEGAMAIVELTEGELQKIPKIFIPDAKEGDCIEIEQAEVSRFYFASIDNDMMTVLTPKGKYALSRSLLGSAKPGNPITFTVSKQETEKRKSRILGLMSNLFE